PEAEHAGARAHPGVVHAHARAVAERQAGKDLERPRHGFHRELRTAILPRGMDTATQATVRVRFFARYAELVGRSEAAVSLPLPATVGDVVRRVREDFPGASALPERPLAAVNLKQVKLAAAVPEGGGVGVVPPIAGG